MKSETPRSVIMIYDDILNNEIPITPHIYNRKRQMYKEAVIDRVVMTILYNFVKVDLYSLKFDSDSNRVKIILGITPKRYIFCLRSRARTIELNIRSPPI